MIQYNLIQLQADDVMKDSRRFANIGSVFIYELIRIVRHKDLRIMVLVAPLLYGILLTSVYYSASLKDLKMGVVDLDNTRLTRLLVRWMDVTSGIKVTGRFENERVAKDELLKGDIDSYVVFPKDFTEEIKRGGDGSTLLMVNASNIIKANPIILSFMQATRTASAALFINYARKKGNSFRKAYALNQSLVPDINILFNPDLEYSLFILPGILFMILQQILLVALTFTFSEERSLGSFQTVINEGATSTFAFFAGKMLPHLLLQNLYSIVFIYIILPGYGIYAVSHPVLILGFVYFSLVTISIFAAALSLLFKNPAHALISLMFFTLPAFFLSGYSWPKNALVAPLQWLGFLLPSTHFLNPFRMMILGDIPWDAVAPEILHLAILQLLYGSILFLGIHFTVRSIVKSGV